MPYGMTLRKKGIETMHNAIQKNQGRVIRDLLNAIIAEGYLVRVRCSEEGDLLSKASDKISDAEYAIDSVEASVVEAVSSELNPRDHSIKYWFFLVMDGDGPDVIADLCYSDAPELAKIYAAAIY